MLRTFCFAFMALSVIAIPIEETSFLSNPLYERDVPPPLSFCNYAVDGGPQGSAFHHQQVTDNTACGSESCSVGKLKSHTFGVELGIAGFDAEKVPVPLQFGVTDSWTSGETYTCDGDGEMVCVWVNVAYTKFNTIAAGTSCPKNSKPGQVQFPNKDNAGGGYYCVRGDQYCRSLGANYWE
ncbi:MAG: hypothetical protein Q9228_007354 [Teloschistes exilis]